jgi:type I restriction enzyme R subunit
MLVEAKRTTKSATVGQQQAKLYADCLEKPSTDSAPSSSTPTVTSTGFGTTCQYPPRAMQGFYKKEELDAA